ncbi:MAG: MarR family transcriptional regulator [Marmoricola sp.]|nr:MarR family transcriptional regulator [Marmoricola sp.]
MQDPEEPRWLDDDERRAWLRLVMLLEVLPGVLDGQLRRDAGMTHFEYTVLAMLSEAPDRTLRMTALAARSHATLPRLSHVVARLVDRGLVERRPSTEDGRVTDVELTDAGHAALVAAAPGHVGNVRAHVLDPLTPAQVAQLEQIAEAMVATIPAAQRMLEAWEEEPGAR